MKITIVSLFPSIVEAYCNTSIIEKARMRGLLDVIHVNIRDYAHNKHKTCDDIPYGGGAGMVLKPEPLSEALNAYKTAHTHIIYPSPSGVLFTQKKAYELAQHNDLLFICGRYEGIDQRIIDSYVDEELSVGEYVLSSGEVASMVIIDTVYRLREGVISMKSLQEESYANGLLEYPHYTRPAHFLGMDVPDVLLSGNHAQIAQWRLEQSIAKTKKNRPELLNK